MKRWATVVATAIFACGSVQAGIQGDGSFKKVRKKRAENISLVKGSMPSDFDGLSRRINRWIGSQNQRGRDIPLKRPPGQKISPPLGQLGDGHIQIWKDERTGLPFFAVGSWAGEADQTLKKPSAEEKVFNFLRKNEELFGLRSPAEEFRIRQILRDNTGETHVRLHQIYRGLDVWGKDIVIHVAANGSVRGFNGRYAPTPLNLVDCEGRISPDEAVIRVREDVEVGGVEIDECEKKIYVLDSGQPVLVWHVIVRFGFNRWYYFIDALTGEIVHRIDYTMTDGITTGTGTDLSGNTQTVQLYQEGADFFLMDLTKPMYIPAQSDPPQTVVGGIVILDIQNEQPDTSTSLYYVNSSDKNVWPPNAVSMEVALGRIYDYYRDVHDRNSIDGLGMTLYSIINLGENYNNAYWNGKAMWFGNGDGNNFSDICGALDVIAHELTHGVTQYTSNLIYENQSGALNESMSDIFGAFAEWHVEGDNGDWLIGEDVTTPGTPGDALRDMENPSGPNAVEKLPATMSEYVTLPNTEEGDWGGVHTNCSIVSRACVLIAQSIGRSKTEQIFYWTQTRYLTQSSQFIDARLSAVQAAKDIYGAGGAEEQAVKNAFDVVEIFDDDPTPPPTDYSPVEGEQWVLAVDSDNGSLHRCRPIVLDESDIELLTMTGVSNRPSVSDDGSFILFVDGNNDLVGIASDGSGEENLTQGYASEGLIRSVALSPNAQWLSFTSIFEDSTIYILDLTYGVDHKTHKLYSPVTVKDTPPVYDVLYADAMDWTFDGQYILYDCYHESPTTLGWSIGYWSINMIRAGDGTIYNIFGAQPEGVSVGNPVFASTNDYIFAYDYLDADNNTSILAANLETGSEGIIVTDNYGKLGYPTYNPQDNVIAFHTSLTDGFTTWDGIGQIQLEADKITGLEQTASVYLQYATFPVWFAIGSRTGVEADESSVPLSMKLGGNYPNPFNPETCIPFQVSVEASTQLTVFNLLGERVVELVNEILSPGQYSVDWQGVDQEGHPVPSGVYICRLKVGERVLSRKMVLMR